MERRKKLDYLELKYSLKLIQGKVALYERREFFLSGFIFYCASLVSRNNAQAES